MSKSDMSLSFFLLSFHILLVEVSSYERLSSACFRMFSAWFLTFIVFKADWVVHPCAMERDRPKSQILVLQSEDSRMFADFKSRCIMLASWQKAMEHKVL